MRAIDGWDYVYELFDFVLGSNPPISRGLSPANYEPINQHLAIQVA